MLRSHRLLLIIIFYYVHTYVNKDIEHSPQSRGASYIASILQGNTRRCLRRLRMSEESFYKLIRFMTDCCSLKDSRWITANEQVVIWLNIVGHGLSNSDSMEMFQRSGETIQRYLITITRSLGPLYKRLVRLPDPTVVPERA